MFHVFGATARGGQGVAVRGGSAAWVISRVHAVCQGQPLGRWIVTRRAEVATRQGSWMSLRRGVAVVAFARSGAARAPAIRVRLNAIAARTSQAGLAGNTPGGRCARAEFFRSAWTCSMIACPRWVLSAAMVSGRVGWLPDKRKRAGMDVGVEAGSELAEGMSRSRSPAPGVTHDPGKTVLDLAVTVALAGDCLADVAVVRAQPEMSGP